MHLWVYRESIVISIYQRRKQLEQACGLAPGIMPVPAPSPLHSMS